MSDFELVFQKFLGQILFRPTMLSFNAVSNIAGPIEDDFEEWRAKKSEDVVLYSPASKQYFNIAFDGLTYSSESLCEAEYLISQTTKYLGKVYDSQVSIDAIRKVRRIGARFVRLYKTNFDFDDLVDLIFNKFYSNSSNIKRISGENIRDNVFILESIKSGLKNRVQIGPLKWLDFMNAVKPSFDLDNSLSDIESFIFMDVDVHLDAGIEPDAANSNLLQAINGADSIAKDYFDYLIS